MTSTDTSQYSIAELNSLDDAALIQLDWKILNCFNGRLLELHAEGALGNDNFAKLPRKPILCIDQIEVLNEERIEASFRFPEVAVDWAYETDEPLEMLFQDQLDQLVGFWGARKINGIGRALSSGVCTLHQSLDYVAGKTLRFVMVKRKWMESANGAGGTAVFNGQILADDDSVILETKNVIVGILDPEDIKSLRKQFGGTIGVAEPGANDKPNGLRIPIYDTDNGSVAQEDGSINRDATQAINPDLWPLRYHFRGDPVVPGNFGTHGLLALLKATAKENFGLTDPIFKSMKKKSFSGMIFENPKLIRFELIGVTKTDDGKVVADTANLFLENSDGSRMIETPIYTFRQVAVAERN